MAARGALTDARGEKTRPGVPELRVAALAATPVKGLRLARREQVRLGRGGVDGDRRFYLIDARGRMVSGTKLGSLQEVRAEIVKSGARDHLALTFADGQRVAGEVGLGEEVRTTFYRGARQARLVRGPFADALSAHAGVPLRLVTNADGSPAVDRGEKGAVTLLTRASLAPLAELAGREVDPRRFRMSIEIDGAEAFEEDRWIGREIEIGGAKVLPRGHVGRCIVTTRHPDTGVSDLATLEHLRTLRGAAATTEPLAFGVYGAVISPGVVRLGDAVRVGGAVRSSAPQP
jgi:uncharacterized protein YcbX